MLADNVDLARQLTESIEVDIDPSNSWQTTSDFNPDSTVDRMKRFRLWFNSILPLEPVL
jgi:hypothetical protein